RRAHAAPRSCRNPARDALRALAPPRLVLTPAVPPAKPAAGRGIEDPAQEARVLAGVREWSPPAGLAPAAVEALFRELIRAARAVQDRFAARPWPVDPLDLETAARPALSRVSHEIVERAAAVAREPAAGEAG